MRRWIVLLALASSGCFGGTPDPPRFFEPLLPARGAAPVTSEAPSVRLRTVDGAQLLGDRVVWRRSDVELGVYEQERWTEEPAAYLERHLGRELFEVRRLRRGGRDAAFALDVRLLTFEEVLAPAHRARVVVWALLSARGDEALLEATYEASEPVGSEDAEAMARAMGAALDAAVVQLSDALQAALAKRE